MALTSAPPSDPPSAPDADLAGRPRLVVPTLVVGLLVGVLVVLAWPPGDGGARDGAAPGSPPPRAAATRSATRLEARAAGVLRAWDARRAQAWATGDAAALAALYVPGSTAGEADVAMLGDWTGRDLTVEGLTTQLLSVRVLAHGPGRWLLRVRDRVAAGTVTGRGATTPLPGDTVAERRVELRCSGGEWRVASVEPVRRAASPAP